MNVVRTVVRQIALSSLKPISILFDGDFYELASFMLSMHRAKQEGSHWTSRPTVHGVAVGYARLIVDVEVRQIEAYLKEYGIDLGAMIEFDDKLA
jgi:hypothetical protein